MVCTHCGVCCFFSQRVARHGAEEVPYVAVVNRYSWMGSSEEYHHTLVCKFLSCGCKRAFFSTSDRASKEVRNTREPDLRVA